MTGTGAIDRVLRKFDDLGRQGDDACQALVTSLAEGKDVDADQMAATLKAGGWSKERFTAAVDLEIRQLNHQRWDHAAGEVAGQIKAIDQQIVQFDETLGRRIAELTAERDTAVQALLKKREPLERDHAFKASMRDQTRIPRPSEDEVAEQAALAEKIAARQAVDSRRRKLRELIRDCHAAARTERDRGGDAKPVDRGEYMNRATAIDMRRAEYEKQFAVADAELKALCS